MPKLIKCPHCQKEIELSEALTHEIRENQRLEIEKEAEKKLREKITNESALKMRDQDNEIKEMRERNRELTEQILQMNKTLRELNERDEERELTMQKALLREREKAKLEAGERVAEENRLKLLEKDKQLTDMNKMLEEARRKAEQGSQQTQGEVLELDLENALRRAFPADEILEVKKGARGADLVQEVKTPLGNTAGKIIWEHKRTKNWEDKWIEKLRADQRVEKAELAGLISITMPKNAKREIICQSKVWITTSKHFLALATLLRDQLLIVAKHKAISAQSSDTAKELFNYLTSHEFSQQMEAIAETYLGLTEQIIKEKMQFEKQWKQREMQLNKMYKSLFNIYGGITGIAGASMPQIKGLDLLEEGEESKEQKLL